MLKKVKFLTRASLIAMLGLFSATCYAQEQRTLKVDSAKADSVKVSSKPKSRSYTEVITSKAKTSKGLFFVHQVEDKYYFELPVKLFKKDMLIINRIAEASADMRIGKSISGFAGDPIGGSVVQFEFGNNKNIFIRRISFTEYSNDSTKSMYAAVKKNTVQPIVAAFPIAAYNKDSTNVVIDVTTFVNGDTELLYFASSIDKMMLHIGVQRNDRSYLRYIHTFPTNVEIRAVKTYAMAGSTRTGDNTMELNASIVLLPEKPLVPRYYDERVGYFTTDFTDYDKNPQGVSEVSFANRWRLEPKPNDVAKYKRGELVEPLKQIVFYIDPATPKKWVPYLIQGVNDWNKAFEKAGFKNAIIGKIAPTAKEDPTFSLEDARHSAIIYKPSIVPNASGPSIADPRTGEILESHINWYHNVMSLIRNWYMVQAGAIDPRARQMIFSDELMGELIRFVSSHEVGHTLGLRHNFGSSSTVPVENLRNKKWVEEHGHTPSIMDYARFNYVAQPEDNIGKKGIYPRIGDYDEWSIEWGYKWFDNKTSEQEQNKIINALTTKMQENKRLWFGSELSPTDPRSQNEDLGDNSMKASEYGIKNLKRIVPQLIKWTSSPQKNYNDLLKIYLTVNGQMDRYAIHVIKNVAGIYVTPKVSEQSGPVYVRESYEKQKEAMEYLDRNIFTYPIWLYDEEIMGKLGIDFIPFLSDKQQGVLESLMSPFRMTRMIEAEALGKGKVYTISEFFSDLDHSIFKEVYNKQAINVYKRNYQKLYIEKLGAFLRTNSAPTSGYVSSPQDLRGPGYTQVLNSKYSDMQSIIRLQLKELRKTLKENSLNYSDLLSKAHIEDLLSKIDEVLKDTK
ncbi:zinc-dependent metalloprotease [Pedobacter frigidisoli]|uniref:zinc-dependent metalloprotease n=1 Tax=Pedobacter frigidisoli TaxID=2530455 RepID=UPI00292E2799|nr:zinc-dependent metalloprotease [Pedobacter frigidisoli]